MMASIDGRLAASGALGGRGKRGAPRVDLSAKCGGGPLHDGGADCGGRSCGERAPENGLARMQACSCTTARVFLFVAVCIAERINPPSLDYHVCSPRVVSVTSSWNKIVLLGVNLAPNFNT